MVINYISVGGAGLGVLETCIVAEELAYGCSGIGTALGANVLGSMPVVVAGNDAQKKEYLGRLINEPIVCVSGNCSCDIGNWNKVDR